MPQPTRAAVEDACSAYAPGRVELLGNHTDYNEGVVLGAAIDRGVTVSGAAREDGRFALRSSARGEADSTLAPSEPQKQERAWANDSLGVARQLQLLGLPIAGF